MVKYGNKKRLDPGSTSLHLWIPKSRLNYFRMIDNNYNHKLFMIFFILPYKMKPGCKIKYFLENRQKQQHLLKIVFLTPA